MGKLEGRTAVITGAAGGMGRVGCRMFCEEGARVIGADLDSEGGKQLQEELTGAGHDFSFRRVDVTAAADVQAFADHVREVFGALNILYNNAGSILGKPMMETTEEEWDKIHAINSKSIFLMTKAFVPLMKGTKGSIINVSSIGGVSAFENMSAYGAAKAGAAHFSRVAAVELAPDIRVNAICPGVIDTPMPRAFMSTLPNRDEIWSTWEQSHLVKRFGKPEEVVSLALWLASEDAGFMTGAALPIDGGYSTV